MALGNEGKLLAASLTALKQVTDKNNSMIIESDEISRTHRERLEAAGFHEPIMQGWYAFARPSGIRRVETAWGSAYWEFVARYLEKRFGENYWLNPVGSLRLHAEKVTFLGRSFRSSGVTNTWPAWRLRAKTKTSSRWLRSLRNLWRRHLLHDLKRPHGRLGRR